MSQDTIYVSAMRVEELDDLAAWFKKNVLDVQPSDEGGLSVQANRYVASSLKLTVSLDRQDDELSLIEYIIGINDIK